MTPRIYVACLASYNAGTLHGKWIDADQDADSIHTEIKEMLAESQEGGAEEYAIHDFEGFGSYELREFTDIETVSQIAEAIRKHGEIITDILNHLGGDIDDAIKCLEEQYQGEYNSLEDWASEFLEDCGFLNEIPENLRYYFDFEKYARDAELNGDIFTIKRDRKVHVFFNE